MLFALATTMMISCFLWFVRTQNTEEEKCNLWTATTNNWQCHIRSILLIWEEWKRVKDPY